MRALSESHVRVGSTRDIQIVRLWKASIVAVSRAEYRQDEIAPSHVLAEQLQIVRGVSLGCDLDRRDETQKLLDGWLN